MKTFEAIDFLSCRKELNNLSFSDNEINNALKICGFNKDSLTDKKGYRIEPMYLSIYEVTKQNHQFKMKEYNGQWEKEVYVSGIEVRVIAQYQGLKHGDIIKTLLMNRFEWFDSFQVDKNYKEKVLELDYLGRLDINKLTEEQKKLTIDELIKLTTIEVVNKKSAWSLHEMTREDYEIYLTTEFGTLYVPIKAILNNDFSLIKNRLESYALDYCDPINLSGFALNNKGRTKEEYKKDKEKDYANMIKPLESKEAKLLQKYLKK